MIVALFLIPCSVVWSMTKNNDALGGKKQKQKEQR